MRQISPAAAWYGSVSVFHGCAWKRNHGKRRKVGLTDRIVLRAVATTNASSATMNDASAVSTSTHVCVDFWLTMFTIVPFPLAATCSVHAPNNA